MQILDKEVTEWN